MDNETLQAITPHSLWEWFLRAALILVLFSVFLLFQHLYEKKKGGNTYDTIDTMRGWLLYTVIAIMLAGASFFFGLAGFIGFWFAWAVVLVLIQASKK